ncbi:MAG: HAMP domain-containing sensor histidine kinase [Rhodocyclaceae bacterium]|nr:HAMP domain-containing sensor histidine kinase [Rhodocyclaceae bacterium]
MSTDAPSPHRELSPDNGLAEAEVNLEKTLLLFRNTGVAQAVAVMNASVLVFSLGGLQPPAWALAWWLIMAAVAALRYGFARHCLASDPTAASVARWRQRAIDGALAAGVVTALGCAAMMVADPGETRLLTVMVMAGNVAGALPILSSVPRAYQAYAVPMLLSLILTALFDPHGVRDKLIILESLVYMGAVLRSTRYLHDNLDRSMRIALHMRQAADQLELARTHELDALALEREVHREQRQFVAMLSHELRTPLAVINVVMQNMALFDADELAPSARARVAKAQAAIARLMSITDECLTPERLGVGHGTLALEAVPVRALLEDAAKAAQLHAEDHRVEIACEPAVAAWCDASLLRLVLRTLVDNAVKYTPAGSCVVLRALADQPAIRIEVADDGPGILADELPHIFEKYFRGRSALAHAGTGLGLPLARQMIVRMGGSFDVASTPESGTVFTVTLPSAQPAAAAA